MTTPTIPEELRQTQSIICVEKRSSPRVNSYPSTCRHCRFYKPEGRRGGHCQQIEAFVHGNWQSCALALPAFAQSWEGAEPNRMQ